MARAILNDDEQLYTGKVDGEPANTFPFPIDRQCCGTAKSDSIFSARPAMTGSAAGRA